jgi:hypothetical protein
MEEKPHPILPQRGREKEERPHPILPRRGREKEEIEEKRF